MALKKENINWQLKFNKYKYTPMPSPSQREIERPEFEALFQLIKDWDISVPDYYTGYTSGNGSHVKLILDAIKQPMRDGKINDIIGDEEI